MQTKDFLRSCMLLALSGATLFAESTSKRKSPTSKFYVAEVAGFAQVNTGDKIEDLTEKSVFDADGTVVETKPESENAMVMSNGVGIFFAPETKLAINRFLQEPFQPNRTDLETEPSVSQTRTRLSNGSVGLCSGKLVAGSSMIYDTPNGSLNILSQSVQKLSVEIGDDSTTVTLFEGALTLRGDKMAGGEALQPGQQAVIKSRGANQPPEIIITEIKDLPSAQKDRLENMVNGACQARKKVYFDTAKRLNELEAGDEELVPIPINPTSPTDVGPIVSPARSTTPRLSSG